MEFSEIELTWPNDHLNVFNKTLWISTDQQPAQLIEWNKK